jgi:hypothetical protein
MKAKVTLGGTPLSGVGAIAWRFQTGTRPYLTTFNVHNSVWKSTLKGKVGKPLVLEVRDSRGVTNTVRDLYILHVAPGGSPNRTSFVVADKRWKWAYPLIVRDYNISKKSGNRSNKQDVPIPGARVADVYDFKPYSLKGGDSKWTAKEAVKDVLEQLEPENHIIEAFPIKGDGGEGQFTLQNIMLRDQGGVALGRLLSYIPAAEVYIDRWGKARVIDAADFEGLQSHFDSLDPHTWDGDKAELVDRKAIRPSQVNVYYQREVEFLVEFEDDARTRTQPDPDAVYCENVIQTVDPETTIGSHFDPETKEPVADKVAQGTWEEFFTWLAAMEKDRPPSSFPWTFQTIREQWVVGDLEGALGGRPGNPKGVADSDSQDKLNAVLRVQSLKRHFRQTFRINERYMNRIRDIQAHRAGLLDPVTGMRAASSVWGQAMIIPTEKGKQMSHRKDKDKDGILIQIDSLPAGEKNLNTATVSPAQVVILDRDKGLFRIEWMGSPYGTDAGFIPCHTVNANGAKAGPGRDLSKQDEQPMGMGMTASGLGTGLFLSPTMEFKMIITMVPGAPNNKKQLHVEEVKVSEISDLFRKEYKIQQGQGPILEVYVPPGEATARFEWQQDKKAKATMIELLGLNSDDPNEAGLDDPTLNGFGFVNGDREIHNHARAVAAEALAAYADNIQGQVATVMSRKGLTLKGNMGGTTLQVAGAPSAKVNVVHNFPGQAKPISRFAMLSDTARFIVLGIVPIGDER